MADSVKTMLPAVVAGTPLTQVVEEIPAYGGQDFAVGRVELVSPSAIANPGATNFATITVRQLRAGAFVQNLAVLSLANLAVAAETATLVPLSVTPNLAILQSGDVVDVVVAHTGTGQALPASCTVEIEFSA